MCQYDWYFLAKIRGVFLILFCIVYLEVVNIQKTCTIYLHINNYNANIRGLVCLLISTCMAAMLG